MLLNWLLRIWSLLPLFALTLDLNYGYNEKPERSNLRFSILNLRLGKSTYYLLTFVRKEGQLKFEPIENLRLDECQWKTLDSGVTLKEKDSYIKDLSTKYVNEHLVGTDTDEKAIEKEFLGYLQDNLGYRKSLSYDKMNYYTAIILVFIPLGPSFFKTTFSPAVQNCSPFFYAYVTAGVLLLYCLLNWWLLAMQYMSVSGIEKSSFKEIKAPPEGRDKQTQQLYSYYHDWQEERFETDLRVSYVKETELLVKCATFLIVIVILLPVAAHFWEKSFTSESRTDAEIVFNFDTVELEDPFSADSIELAELHAKIRRNRPEALVVFIGTETVAIDVVNENFRQYKEYVVVNTYADSKLSVSEFKVALLEGEK